MVTDTYVVMFDCDEAVLRTGTREEVNHPDDLGCQVMAVYPLSQVEIDPWLWNKNGEVRCLVKRVLEFPTIQE